MINSKQQSDNNLNTNFTGPARLLAAAVAATSLSAVTAPAQGGLMRDISLDPQHQALGNTYRVGGSALANTGGGTAALRINPSSGFAFASSASITMLTNEWGACALHEFQPYLDAGGAITGNVVLGSNYNTNPGISSAIRQVIPFPGGSGSNPALADFCLVRFDPIAGMQNAVLGSFPGVGTNVFMAGYGRYGSQATGALPRDGNIRGWLAPVDSTLPAGFSSEYYVNAGVRSINQANLLGRGLIGDSGGGVYDSLGRTVGIITAGTNGTQFVGDTTILRFDNPGISSFIASTIPSPSAGAVLLGAALMTGARRRR